MDNKFYKNLQIELCAKKEWEFTEEIKRNIWNTKYDDGVIASYKNGETYEDGTPMKFGWQLEAEPIFEAFEEVQRKHMFDYLDTYYIKLRYAYNYWKQYEHEWNLKYKDYIK